MTPVVGFPKSGDFGLHRKPFTRNDVGILIYWQVEKVVQIRFYANMRTIAGQETFDVADLGGVATLRDLFLHLIKTFPEIHPYLFDAHNDLRQDVPIFVNGRNPRLDGSMNTPLRADDVISLFSPISSGKMNVEVLRDEKENIL